VHLKTPDSLPRAIQDRAAAEPDRGQAEQDVEKIRGLTLVERYSSSFHSRLENARSLRDSRPFRKIPCSTNLRQNPLGISQESATGWLLTKAQQELIAGSISEARRLLDEFSQMFVKPSVRLADDYSRKIFVDGKDLEARCRFDSGSY
jgi:hypothetical protein